MPSIKFDKYQGAGNDFIMLDGRNLPELSTEQIKFLCDRHFGIGSDGLIILKNSPKFDFQMQFFNPDGSEASFCGNGGRCIVKFAQQLGIINDFANFIAKDGRHTAQINGNIVRLQMNDVSPVVRFNDFVYLNTGTHHVVKFVENLDTIDIEKEALPIRHSENFQPEGTNVNFVEIKNNYLKIRTFEKGVEQETLACGTGITAAALAYADLKQIKSGKIQVEAKGGTLFVEFLRKNQEFTDIYLTGNADFVFNGEINFERLNENYIFVTNQQ